MSRTEFEDCGWLVALFWAVATKCGAVSLSLPLELVIGRASRSLSYLSDSYRRMSCITCTGVSNEHGADVHDHPSLSLALSLHLFRGPYLCHEVTGA